MLCALAVTGLFAISSSGQAAVYDFGNLSMTSPGNSTTPNSFAQRASAGKSSDMWMSDRNISSLLISESASIGSAGITYESGALKFASGSKNDYLLASVAYNDMQRVDSGFSINIPVKETVKEPVTAAPESQHYAMILGGFGLLCFSARRRKSNTFD
jgi:hypothetical protein